MESIEVGVSILFFLVGYLYMEIRSNRRYFQRELSAYRTEMTNRIERAAAKTAIREAQGAPATPRPHDSMKRKTETWMVLPPDTVLPPGITPASAMDYQLAVERAWDQGYAARGKGASNPYREDGVEDE